MGTNLSRIVIHPHQIEDRHIALTEVQQHYLSRVLRLQPGDRFYAIDGQGSLYLAEITTDRPKIIELVDTQNNELPLNITLICALPKGNGFDDVVRACTELGVTTILPTMSDRTLLQPSPQKLLRWRKIAEEAAEQSERIFIPQIGEPRAYREILAEVGTSDLSYICEARGEYPHLVKCLATVTSMATEIVIAIGPEGGWTEPELNTAIASGFQPVSLGKRVLRSITAPIVVMSLVAGILES